MTAARAKGCRPRTKRSRLEAPPSGVKAGRLVGAAEICTPPPARLHKGTQPQESGVLMASAKKSSRRGGSKQSSAGKLPPSRGKQKPALRTTSTTARATTGAVSVAENVRPTGMEMAAGPLVVQFPPEPPPQGTGRAGATRAG